MRVSNSFSYSTTKINDNVIYNNTCKHIDNKEIKLGNCIARGVVGTVYNDAENPKYVIKEMKASYGSPENEVKLFNEYYGEKSANIVGEMGGNFYVRMKKLPGIPLGKINEKVFPAYAVDKFHEMLCTLGDKNIMHFDLNLGNILYDDVTNKFYPIDFDNIYDVYFSADQERKSSYNQTSDALYKSAVEHIRKNTIDPIPLKQGCIVV